MANAKRDENDVPTLLAVSSADGVTPVVVWADPDTHRLLCQLVGGGGSNPFQQPTSGALNQRTFTWTNAPQVIVVDGVPKQKVQSDGTVNWTGTTTTVLTVAPVFDIFSTN